MLEPSPAHEPAPATAIAKKARHASRGQILILTAGAMVGLIRLLGLATDLGYEFVERHSMQNAADAADNPPPDPNTNRMWTVTTVPFYLSAAAYSNGTVNKLDGKVMGDHITLGNGKPGRIPGTQGPIVIRLTK